MSVDTFDVVDFHTALAQALINIEIEQFGHENNTYLINHDGVVGGEYRFKIPVRQYKGGEQVNILVNSSVMATGQSAPNGDNSIRGWIVDQDNQPLSNKTQRWVTRQPGWQERMQSMLKDLLEMSNNIRYCKSCNKLERVFKVKKEGPNKGRLFRICGCDNSFQWLDGNEDERGVDVVPTCPECGSKMILRSGKYGEFWGCSTYPNCRGTRNVGQEELEPKDFQNRQHKTAEKLPGKPVPSQYQQKLFDWVDKVFNPEFADVMLQELGQNIIVQASAGTGKTTTGKWMFQRMPVSFNGKQLKLLSVTFARKNALDLQKKLPKRVKATTTHSLGFTPLRKSFKLTHENVDDDKVKYILEAYADFTDRRALVGIIIDIVGKVKAALGNASDANLDDLTDFYDIALNGDREFVYDAVRYVMKRSREITDMVDFNDMVWLPVVLDLPCEKYDVIFLDEAQDTNPVGFALLQKHCHPGTKFIAVGDEFQSIYAFRGADVNSMSIIKDKLNASQYVLPVTYRCPKSAVRMINEMYPEIPFEAAPDAIEGEIVYETMDEVMRTVKSGDMFVCRMNAPLVAPCMQLIAQGIKAIIYGKDIGKGLIALIDKMKAGSYGELMQKLSEYEVKEVARLLDIDKEMQAQAVKDKVSTIYAIAESLDCNNSTVDGIIRKIESIFSDDEEGVIFCTIHKAKGLEADNVGIIKSELLPHPKAKEGWGLRQEFNMDYVARTRHKKRLTIVVED